MQRQIKTKLSPVGLADIDVTHAHTHSSYHREALLRSGLCGCFYCLQTFPPEAIEEWTDAVNGLGMTAICPMCGIDSVLGDTSGFSVERWFLAKMAERWFGKTP